MNPHADGTVSSTHVSLQHFQNHTEPKRFTGLDENCFTVPDEPILNVDELVNNYDGVEVPDTHIDLACHESSFSNSSDEDSTKTGHRKRSRKRIKLSHSAPPVEPEARGCNEMMDELEGEDLSLSVSFLDDSYGSLQKLGDADVDCNTGENTLLNGSTTSDLLSQSTDFDSMTLEFLLSVGNSPSLSPLLSADLTSCGLSLSNMSELSPQSHFGFSQDFLSSNATQNTSFETRESSIGELNLDETSSAVLDSSTCDLHTEPLSADHVSNLFDLELSGRELSNPFHTQHHGPAVPTSSDDELANILGRRRRRRELNSCAAQLVPDIDHIEE
ncbi:hypothetical protein EB796_017491 [Bugula neritina]|uniref:Uncharacterized protein n=1 Tax=Bugula neritina TaxID=10212 RepID=A0A7J7JFS2_BUGNE|nr:hypothetical protein EB796_017491 [Bugula neritina]